MAEGSASPGWKRLWRHSYFLGLRWLLRVAPRWKQSGRAGFARLLVPLDPWRYYELGRVADQPFGGRCLDVSSPKLLPSLLQREGSGEWTCIDLFSREIESWRWIDPTLTLEVQDALDLPYPDDTFDNVVCLSVLEHVGVGKDRTALAEMHRVLKPGGLLHLTTDVAEAAKDVFVTSYIYGEASQAGVPGEVFFKHDYSVAEFNDMFDPLRWITRHQEFAVQNDPFIEENFYRRAPWSYAYGPLLRYTCPKNFTVSGSSSIVSGAAHAVVYVQSEKLPST